MGLTPCQIEILRQAGTGNGFPAEDDRLIDHLERRGLIRVHWKQRSSMTRQVDRIAIYLTDERRRVCQALARD